MAKILVPKKLIASASAITFIGAAWVIHNISDKSSVMHEYHTFNAFYIFLLLSTVWFFVLFYMRSWQRTLRDNHLVSQKLLEDLATSNELNSAIMASATHLIISTDPNGVVTFFNSAAEKTLGYRSEDVVNKHTPALWHILDEVVNRAPELSKELGRDIAPGFEVFVAKPKESETESREWTIKRQDGTTFPANLTVTCIRDANNEITGYLGVIEDITGRKEVERQLFESEKLFKLVTEAARDGIWDWPDMDKDEEYWSPQWKALLGYKDDEIEAKASSFFAMLHPDDIDKTKHVIDHSTKTNMPFDVEYRLKTKSGKYKWFQAKGIFTTDDKTQKKRMTGSITSIDDRKKAQDEIKEAKAFLDLINNNNPDLVFVKDEKFRIVEANPAFISLYPKDKQDKVIGYTTFEEFPKEERDVFFIQDKKAFKKGYSETIEQVTFPDGEIRLFNTKKIRFENSKNETFILGLSADVTEREKLIAKLTDSNEELERFAYVCSHDLQEPLRMIKSFSEKLQEHIDNSLQGDEKGKRYFKFVTDGATHAQNLISDILTYSSISRDTKKPTEFSLQNLMKNVIETMRINLEEGNGRVTYDDLPNIMGNKTQIYQLLQNLINNGLRYQKPNTKPHVHVSVKDIGKHWKISVKDNGIGMEERHLNKIFDVFQRLHRKEEYSGTGVGLSICKKVAERHEGTIWVESKKDKGSTFYFTIMKPTVIEKNNGTKRKAS